MYSKILKITAVLLQLERNIFKKMETKIEIIYFLLWRNYFKMSKMDFHKLK